MPDVLVVSLGDLDDDALLRAAMKEPEAFGELYRRYEQPVLAILVR